MITICRRLTEFDRDRTDTDAAKHLDRPNDITHVCQ